MDTMCYKLQYTNSFVLPNGMVRLCVGCM